MQNNIITRIAASRYLSPTDAIKWLAEHRGYKISYRRISEYMRGGTIQSIVEDDCQNGKLPRIRTTVAALEIWFEGRFKENINNTRVRKMQEAAEREADKIGVAGVPPVHIDNVHSLLSANAISITSSASEAQAAEQLALALQRKEMRAQSKAARKAGGTA